MQAHKELDARGLNCPLPILKAKKALAEMKSGDVLKVLATDPGQSCRQARNSATLARASGTAKIEPMVARTASTE